MKSFKDLIITLLLTGLMTLVVLLILSKIFITKYIDHDGNRMQYIIKGFYEEPRDSLEVVITGNSDTYRGISPMEMYNKYGIASYSFVSAGQRAWTAYAMLEEVYRLQSPQIVLFNVDELYSDNQSTANNYIKVYNNMELAGPRLRGIFNKDYNKSIAVKITHFLPIFAFHDRYKELNKDDLKYAFDMFVDYRNPAKGMDVVAVSNPYTGG